MAAKSTVSNAVSGAFTGEFSDADSVRAAGGNFFDELKGAEEGESDTTSYCMTVGVPAVKVLFVSFPGSARSPKPSFPDNDGDDWLEDFTLSLWLLYASADSTKRATMQTRPTKM